MKITKETQKIIKNAIEIATTLGVENIVMDKFSLRGENKELGIAIILPTQDMDLEFDAIGLGRIALLKSRLQMLDGAEIQFDTMDKSDATIVSKLTIALGKTKIGFKCQDPKLINAPKAINDPIFYEMNLNESDVETLIKGIGTMSSDTVNFSTDDDTIFVKISDVQGDMFTHELDSKVELKDDSAPSLSKSYKSKTLRTIFTNYIRKDDNNILPLSITRRGVMKLVILGMNIYLFPER
jgi:hypothetical protein